MYKGSERDTANRTRRREEQRAEDLDLSDKLPEVENKKRKEKACKSLLFFLKTYFKEIFYLDFSPIHLEVISKIEKTILGGDCYALALPRGSGKTSMCECAILWAMLTGKKKSIVLVAASQTRADQIKKEIVSLLTFSEELGADFPEACFPFSSTARTPKRVKRLLWKDAPLRCDNTKSFLVLPAIPGAPCFEATLFAVGLGGSVRGLSYTNIKGEKIRPDLVLIDDPQTRESANSPEQCAERRRIIYADILGLAGAGRKTAVLVTCTVIREQDLADNLLDRSTSPEFNGHRFSLLEKLPDNLKLWGEWDKIRRLGLENEGNEDQAKAFYLANKEDLEAGAVHNWEVRKEPDDPSAIYSAMKLYFRDKESFFSEFQNRPLELTTGSEDYNINRQQLEAQVCKIPRGVLVEGDDVITGFIDVHKNLLYWVLAVWNKQDGSGRVFDFGTYPPQKEPNFKLNSARNTILTAFPTLDYLDALTLSLKYLVFDLTQREYEIEQGGASLHLERLLIDANWGESTEAIYNFIRAERNPILYPTHGEYYGVKSQYKNTTKSQNKLAVGAGWFIPRQATRQGVRRVIIDTNYAKTEFIRRLKAPLGTAGKIALTGESLELNNFFSHLMSEYGTVVESCGRSCVEWQQKPNIDNHWFDCCVGATVAANILGVSDKEAARRKRNVAAFFNKFKERGFNG